MDATRYRGIIAGANDLAADRLNLMYTAKELCRGMARPTKVYWHKLNGLGRHLADTGRTVRRYAWQGRKPDIAGYSDSDLVEWR